MQELLLSFMSEFMTSVGEFQLPLNPAVIVTGLDVGKCKCMGSNAVAKSFYLSSLPLRLLHYFCFALKAPLWLVFKNKDDYGPPLLYIFKSGDDLRYILSYYCCVVTANTSLLFFQAGCTHHANVHPDGSGNSATLSYLALFPVSHWSFLVMARRRP